MSRANYNTRWAFVIACMLIAAAMPSFPGSPARAVSARDGAAEWASRQFVGDQACAQCHADIHRRSAASIHNKILRPATPLTVEGDFTRQTTLQLAGSSFSLQRRGATYFITESDLSGKPWEHRVDYVLGAKRVQHYLATLPDGMIAVLLPTWDNVQKKWIGSPEAHNPEESSRDPVQDWNKECYGCHVSGEQKNFDPQQLRYATRWREPGVSCESCHGPGSEHVAAAKMPATAATRVAIRMSIVNPAKLDAVRSTMVCAQCHSLRDIYVNGFAAGANYYDFFVPVMQYRQGAPNSAYWDDGRPHWLANEAAGLWQSECFLKGGATCLTCHSRSHEEDVARNLQLRGNSICARCHAAIAANIPAHTHHAANSAGNSCVDCHMPRSISSLNAAMRDHTISIPVPENSLRHDIPNACNLCHKDQSAEWAAQQMTRWYGKQHRQTLALRADAFAAAQQNDPSSVNGLLQILADVSAGPLARANAVGALGNFPSDPAAFEAVLGALSDHEPLVRSTAALSIRPLAAQREKAAPALAALLSDSVATVRVNAAVGLAGMGAARQLPQEFRDSFDAAVALYRDRAALNADDPAQLFAAGQFFYLSGYTDDAITAFGTALRLNPRVPARYALARAMVEKGDTSGARQILKEVPADDPQYSAAQQLIAILEANQGNTQNAATQSSTSQGDAQFRDALSAYQNQNYGVALKSFDDALAASPQAAWAERARIDRAVCLARMSRTAEAETAMQSLSSTEGARKDLDFQLAFVELLYDSGRTDQALRQVNGFLDLVPNAPTALLWRARVLLQLGHINDAASSAEEALKLQPELLATHNLLLRIYQMQGRTKEAAQQAAWLREYQRRTE